MVKWKLLMTTLPFVLVALAIKATLHFGFEFTGLVDFSDLGVVLTGAVFLIGLMLSGTMADYKESEKLPGELACALEALQDNLLHAAALKPDAIDAADIKKRSLALAQSTKDWLLHRIGHVDMLDAITRATEIAVVVDKAGAGSHATRALSELQNLRKTITRIGVISRTSFLQTGYALLDTLVVTSIGALMVAKFKSDIGEIIVVPFVTLIFVYMVRLIRDIDDPFDYNPDGSKGAAEADLMPLDELLTRWSRG